MSEKSKNESRGDEDNLPNNQIALQEKLERELQEKKNLCVEVTRTLEKQRREHLEREVQLRQMVAEIVQAEVEKRINSADTTKMIENEAMKLILKRKQATYTENRDVLQKQRNKEIEPLNIKKEKNPKEGNLKHILPLIRDEVRKEILMQNRGTNEALANENNTRGGRLKNARDLRYRHNWNSGKRGQYSSGRGYRHEYNQQNERPHFSFYRN